MGACLVVAVPAHVDLAEVDDPGVVGEEANRVGEIIDFPGWSLDGPVSMPEQAFGIEDVGVLMNSAYPWARPAVGVELRDGVGEIDAGALLEVYLYSQTASATARSQTGTVATKHGLVVRTALLEDAKGEILVAGQLGQGTPGGLDGAFQQLGRTTSGAVVDSVGKMLEYPLDRVAIQGAPTKAQLRPTIFLLLSILLAVAVGSVPRLIRKTRERRRLRA